jgi:hypothetical protein
VAAMLFLSPVQVPARGPLTFAPQPFPTVEDLLYDTYFDLQSSIRRLGRYYQVVEGPNTYQIWSYHHEFDLDKTPHIKFLFSYKILKVYAQVHTENGKPFFKIMLEEIEYRGKKEYVHHIFMEDRNLNGLPDVVEENWVVIDKKDGFRHVKDLKSKGDPRKGEDRIDNKIWNYWFAYWIKVQVLEFKEQFRHDPFPDNPEREA